MAWHVEEKVGPSHVYLYAWVCVYTCVLNQINIKSLLHQLNVKHLTKRVFSQQIHQLIL